MKSINFKNWSKEKLGKHLKLEYGKPLSKLKRNLNGFYPVYGANGIKTRSNEFYYDKQSIIVGRKGSAGKLNITENKFWPLDVTYFVKYEEDKFDFLFLYYLLKFFNLPKLAKGVKPGINRNDVYDINIYRPPLPEQKRIVAILDKAFSAIDKAKQNAEKNLQNSKELFDSYLQSVFANPGEDWEILEFEKSIVKIVYTNKIKRKDFLEKGLYPIVSQEKDLINGFWNDLKDLFKIKQPIVIFGDHTQVVKYVNFNFVLGADGVKILQPKETIFPKYFYYFLSNIKLKNLGYARHYRLLKETKLHFPKSINEQKQIVAKLDSLSAETTRLESKYQQKLANLEELKQSILQKAFNGEF